MSMPSYVRVSLTDLLFIYKNQFHTPKSFITKNVELVNSSSERWIDNSDFTDPSVCSTQCTKEA